MKKFGLLMLAVMCISTFTLAEGKKDCKMASGNMLVEMDKKFVKECKYMCSECGYYNKKGGTCTTCNVAMEKCKDKKACFEMCQKKQLEASYNYSCPKCGAKFTAIPENGKCTTCGKKLTEQNSRIKKDKTK